MMGVLGGQTVCVFEVVDDVQNPSYILYSWSLDGRVPESDDPVVEPDVPVGPSYEEIQRLIKEKEEQLKELSLNKRAAELELRKLQKKLNNGIVTSTVDGTVKSVQDEENAKLQGTPLISVVGEEGFYITGTVAETALDKVPVGMPITVNSWNSGAMYEATITGVGTAPMQGYYGNNANMSYYPFTAVIKGDADLHNGVGVPVAALGIPTVVGAAAIVHGTVDALIRTLSMSEDTVNYGKYIEELDAESQYELIRELMEPEFGPMYVTPQDIDERVKELSFTVSEGIHQALYGSRLL